MKTTSRSVLPLKTLICSFTFWKLKNKRAPCMAAAAPKDKREFNFIADVLEGVLPAVVNIKGMSQKSAGSSLVTTGSGFLVAEDGLIVTAASLVGKHDKFVVRMNDGSDHEGRVVHVQGSSDLAAIKINGTNFNTVKLNKAGSTLVGDWVMAVGSPLSLRDSVTHGVLSNVNRLSKDIKAKNSTVGYYIQTDAIINNGNSGGPLVNLSGEVVGMNALVASAGVGFAVPSEYVLKFVEQVTSKKGVLEKRRHIGLRVLKLTKNIAGQLEQMYKSSETPAEGLYIDSVTDSSPALKAGLRQKDVIVEVNGEPARSTQDISKALLLNEKVVLTVLRNKQTITVEVKSELV